MKCERCGLMRLEPLPSERQLNEHYAARARDGGNYDLTRANERQPNLVRTMDFVQTLGLAPGRLLDVGCFDGGFLDEAAARGWEVWGIEPQAEPAAVAELRHPGRIVSLALEDVGELPIGEFDLITAISVVEHLRQPQALLELADRRLRPGGVLVIHTPDLRSFPARALGRWWPPIAPPEHTFYFDRRTLRRLVERHGLHHLGTTRDVKRLRVQYVYDQFRFFGPEFHRLLGPVVRALPRRARDAQLPLYGGETFFAAVRPPRRP